MEMRKLLVAVVGLGLFAGPLAADDETSRIVSAMVSRINENVPQHTVIEDRRLALTHATADGAVVTQHYVFEEAFSDVERRHYSALLAAAQPLLKDGVCQSLRRTAHWQRILDLGIRYAFEYRDAADHEVASLHVNPVECG